MTDYDTQIVYFVQDSVLICVHRKERLIAKHEWNGSFPKKPSNIMWSYETVTDEADLHTYWLQGQKILVTTNTKIVTQDLH